MAIEIRALTTEDASIFIDYFTGPHFGHAPHWAGCFCRYYQAEVSQETWVSRKGEDNRQEAIAEIEAGRMKGYLAFDGDTCVGWCNANTVSAYIRVRDVLLPLATEGEFGATLCFVIHPKYRGQGLARKMLKHIVNEYQVAGYAGMLAAPFDSKENPEKRYRGTIKMYEEMGYSQVEEKDGIHTMKLIF